MVPRWVLWAVTWWESANGCELWVSDEEFPGNLQMDPGLAKWTVFWSEKLNGGELGASDGGSLGSRQVGLGLGMRKGMGMGNT